MLVSAAIAYMILGCRRIARVNPTEYPRDVLPPLARRIQLIRLPEHNTKLLHDQKRWVLVGAGWGS
jgi:hypothetical protein